MPKNAIFCFFIAYNTDFSKKKTHFGGNRIFRPSWLTHSVRLTSIDVQKPVFYASTLKINILIGTNFSLIFIAFLNSPLNNKRFGMSQDIYKSKLTDIWAFKDGINLTKFPPNFKNASALNVLTTAKIM